MAATEKSSEQTMFVRMRLCSSSEWGCPCASARILFPVIHLLLELFCLLLVHK